MGKNIYVGSLPFDYTEDQLHELFAKEGAVQKTQLIRDRDTGMSRGFGFVEMASDDEAKAAIAKLNGLRIGDRQITVNEARPRADRNEAGAGRGRGSFSGARRGGRRW
ncbi:MAG: RNA-binding protein [Elusimicrobia bacterium]|nr:RNA-binding protein [Elusimicrobiota bacterium]